MKIDRVSASSASSTRKTSSKSNGSRFSVAESVSGPAESAPIAAAGPLAALEGLLAVQEADSADGYKGKQARAISRGHDLLDMLDEVRLGLMMGGVPKSRLDSLVRMVERRRDTLQDPNLVSVLDEIELRARVEIAKLELATK